LLGSINHSQNLHKICFCFALQHANEDVEKMILGNKCDMEDRRIIPKERGEAIAKEHGIRYMETSAKANINIETAFTDLAEAILNKVRPHFTLLIAQQMFD
jgi:GTPase SAR1 family protein